MAETGGTKILAFFTICVMLITVGLSECIGDDNNDERDESKVIVHYEIEINTTSIGEYYIFVPIPLTTQTINKNKQSKILDLLEFEKGDGIFTVESNSYGIGLNISSNKSMKLIAHKEYPMSEWDFNTDYVFSAISLTTSETIWGIQNIYFNSSIAENVTLNFHCYSRIIQTRGGENYEWGVSEYSIINGWQKVEMYIEIRIID